MVAPVNSSGKASRALYTGIDTSVSPADRIDMISDPFSCSPLWLKTAWDSRRYAWAIASPETPGGKTVRTFFAGTKADSTTGGQIGMGSIQAEQVLGAIRDTLTRLAAP